jgi:hypothetical protein
VQDGGTSLFREFIHGYFAFVRSANKPIARPNGLQSPVPECTHRDRCSSFWTIETFAVPVTDERDRQKE